MNRRKNLFQLSGFSAKSENSSTLFGNVYHAIVVQGVGQGRAGGGAGGL